MRTLLVSIVCILLLQTNGILSAQGVLALSNLSNPWPGGGIGDIHGLGPEPVVARFTVGSRGSFLNAVTLEFLTDKNSTAWASVNMVILRASGGGNAVRLTSPSLNPLPTQWPPGRGIDLFTRYIDFHPAGAYYLPPFTDFAISLSAPPDGQNALLYTRSTDFTSINGWKMGSTESSNPFAVGEFLKLAVYATAVPEPQTISLGLISLCVYLTARRKAE